MTGKTLARLRLRNRHFVAALLALSILSGPAPILAEAAPSVSGAVVPPATAQGPRHPLEGQDQICAYTYACYGSKDFTLPCGSHEDRPLFIEWQSDGSVIHYSYPQFVTIPTILRNGDLLTFTSHGTTRAETDTNFITLTLSPEGRADLSTSHWSPEDGYSWSYAQLTCKGVDK